MRSRFSPWGHESVERLKEFIRVSRGKQRAELVLKNVRLINVFFGDVQQADVAVYGGRIAGIGPYKGKTELDLQRAYLAPGFIDGHVHMESSMLAPWEYARVVVPKGTSGVVMDPHEIANVLGQRGIRFMLAATRSLPLTVHWMLPSCVPATDLETSGARLSSTDLIPLLQEERVLGMAELMNYPGLLAGDREVLRKIRIAGGRRIDGHAPGLGGMNLCAYVGAGVHSDHECTTREEAEKKIRLGMYIMIREGSAAKNLSELLPAVRPENSRWFLFATDDRGPEDLMAQGHLDYLLRKAVAAGLDPVRAVQMATINVASYFGLDRVGAIAPGYRADMVVLRDLKKMQALKVFKGGALVAEEGKLLSPFNRDWVQDLPSSMKVDWSGLSRLAVASKGDRIKVMNHIPGQLRNRVSLERAKIRNDRVVSDTRRDILKVAVVERHRSSGNVGVGFVKGFGLKRGALGSSVAHDSHNLIVLGTDDEDMAAAAHGLAKMEGGQIVVLGGKKLASLPLPIAGLMSDRPLGEVVAKSKVLKQTARRLGCGLEDPFMALSFLALPVIPDLRITDRGLVDVNKFALVSLEGEE